MEPVKEEKGKSEKKEKSEKKGKSRTDKSEKKTRTDKKSDKKEKRFEQKISIKKMDQMGIKWAVPIDPSMTDRLVDRVGSIAPLLMAAGGVVAYSRYPGIQAFVNSAIGQLMESLLLSEHGVNVGTPRECASVLLPPAS